VNGRPAAAGFQAVLLDVEGTTTPIAFVVDTLFPYARRRLRRHVEEHDGSHEYDRLFDRLRREHDVDAEAGERIPPWAETPPASRLASVVSYAEWLMDQDRKSTALKDLQGRIWEEGYRRGELAGDVFPDVPSAFERWRAAGVGIGIFSSGSVLAQQLLFRYSSAGDLTRLLQWHFDTTTGPKTDVESYRRIAAAMATAPEAVLFVSDVAAELGAAGAGGMQTRMMLRPGNRPPPPDHGFAVIRSLDELV
jgi:enolase-phosphatase E1